MVLVKCFKCSSSRLAIWAISCCRRTLPPLKHHIAHHTAKKWLRHYLASGLRTLQTGHMGLTENLPLIGKFHGKAATAYNERFGIMAGVPRWIGGEKQ